ncbi:ATP-dependent DNA helicase [Mycena chlorophos]|uniref:ATP-dependent DNA helicase n=1 Tax=Mycena chlorophos TaxID=658473 RepID=A0A8H6SU17_MYCCL|nr:ATP-dependent DNA helicase [Mycena chlorophos]
MAGMNKRLLQRCANTLSRQHEFSAPEVISYLMGWGDRFISHTYVRIYWDRITLVLRTIFPELVRSRVLVEPDATMVRDGESRDRVDTEASIPLTLNEDGRFVLKDQLRQYQDRGHALDSMSFYDFFSQTYHGKMLEDPATDAPTRGRPRSLRVPYLPELGRAGCRVIRGAQHEVNLHFIGRWFPRADDPNTEYYSAQMLLLLFPWRTLHDLKNNYPTFHEALDKFKAQQASARDLRVLDNIQYFYQCSDRAGDRRQEDGQADISHHGGEVPDARACRYGHRARRALGFRYSSSASRPVCSAGTCLRSGCHCHCGAAVSLAGLLFKLRFWTPRQITLTSGHLKSIWPSLQDGVSGSPNGPGPTQLKSAIDCSR